ncbi:YHS domain protein [Flavobacterium franklandianum]|uniref:YHS domain-containing (seleno)protein n=1 Tax=Flavobacterium franklandianum TaxID=2594430 RepID=UPI001179C1A1|nr:YHS domain-containing (seleno)protein [Flavobacterium franklandianum]TRX24981.1 YHS domain protein [Flavobacterium franklandianum]
MNKPIFILFLSFLTMTIAAQTSTKRATAFNLENKIAIQGYDPVAYFKVKPSKGNKEISATFEGVIYNFSSVSNRDTFLKKPMSYEPQFGGWCAYAMGSSGDKVTINPETFKIIEGKLYLFYNAFFNNTLKNWNKDEVNLKKKAETNWKKTIN